MKTTPYRIDVHHHLVPPEYVAALEKMGVTDSLGRAFPAWSARGSLDVMDANGIKAAVTGLSSPGVYFGDADRAAGLARLCNEASARLVADRPGRFGAFATLGLPDVAASLRELEYSLDTLKLDGVALLSNYDGRYLGDPGFGELYAELNERNAVVYVHPTTPAGGNPLGREVPTFLMEVTFDTTRAIFNLIFQGVVERYPGIQWIFSHAGGVMPYIAWRVSLGQFILPDAVRTAPRGAWHYLGKLFYDTGLSANPHALRSLQELVAPSQILFGTDYPFAPEILTTETVNGLHAYDGFPPEALAAIEYGNALRLFPRFRKFYDPPVT